LPLQKTCGNKYSRLHENYFRSKRELPMIRVRLLKRRRKEVKVDPKLGGQWKVPKLNGQWMIPCLVANGMFHAWWPMECSMLGGQWKVPCLVAIGRFHAWWPLEGSMFGGHWKVPCLVAIRRFHVWWPLEGSMLGGQWNVKEKHLFTSSIFPQQTLLKPSIFSFDLMVLLYHGSKPLLTPFFPFFLSINYDCAPQCNKSFTPSLSI